MGLRRAMEMLGIPNQGVDSTLNLGPGPIRQLMFVNGTVN